MLPNDRYVVGEIGRGGRLYESVWATDKIKWVGKPAVDTSDEDDNSEEKGSDK